MPNKNYKISNFPTLNLDKVENVLNLPTNVINNTVTLSPKNRDLLIGDKDVKNRGVQRFLSICDIPEEVMLTCNLTSDTILDMVQEDVAPINKKLDTFRKDSYKRSNKYSFFQNGSGLSPNCKAQIIRDIIRNFNLAKYLNDFKAKDVAILKLNKK